MKAVSDALQVSRSNLYERLSGTAQERGRYKKLEDAALAETILPIVSARPTYGYRRIAALLNKQRREQGSPPVNHKRVYRLMAMNSWLLQRHTGYRQERTHDGKVMVMRSNLRWCSDGLEIACWNGEKVRAAFIIDAFYREIIAAEAVINEGISGSIIRDMLLKVVEDRFNTLQSPWPVEILTDNGSCYTALETRQFARSLGLVPCFTPVASPESNGMAESFVKTLKRDYVHVSPLPDSQTVQTAFYRWIEDYNENHPHSGLKYKSPRDFRRAQL